MNNDRSRAWRRHKKYINKHKGMSTNDIWKPEKNWKHLWSRSQKILRGRQLGFEYPRKNIDLEAEYYE